MLNSFSINLSGVFGIKWYDHITNKAVREKLGSWISPCWFRIAVTLSLDTSAVFRQKHLHTAHWSLRSTLQLALVRRMGGTTPGSTKCTDVAAAIGGGSWTTCQRCLRRRSRPVGLGIATTLCWSSASVSEWVWCLWQGVKLYHFQQ